MSELEDLLATLSGGGWSNNPTFTLTLPSNAGTGQARIVIGSPLPPPLDTYLFSGVTLAVGGIIFYEGQGSDTSYAFIALVPQFSELRVQFGFVLNGAVVEVFPGLPKGYLWAMGTASGYVVHRLRTANTAGDSIDLGDTSNTVDALVKVFGQLLLVPSGGATIQVCASKLITNGNLVGPLTTSAAAYADVGGGSQITVAKQYAGTQFKVEMHFAGFSTAVNTVGVWGVQINGVDYDIGAITWNDANKHLNGSGVNNGGAGAAAGNYLVKARWKRTAGAGVVTINNDWFSMNVEEVA